MPDRTAADIAAIDHIITTLNKQIADATRVAETQEAAAEGTSNFTRRLKYEESAEFHRALAARLAEIAEDAKTKLNETTDIGTAPDEWAVARHWQRSTEYSRAMSEDQARELLAEDRVDGLTASLVRRRPAGPWRVADDTHSCDNCSGIDPDTCLFNGEKESDHA